ncbi:hypothetical protein TNCV_4687601 [Trichonephila clavipes]|nr:hypothetical protein TNCV_4687601 [Trichonephila clavipes]
MNSIISNDCDILNYFLNYFSLQYNKTQSVVLKIFPRNSILGTADHTLCVGQETQFINAINYNKVHRVKTSPKKLSILGATNHVLCASLHNQINSLSFTLNSESHVSRFQTKGLPHASPSCPRVCHLLPKNNNPPPKTRRLAPTFRNPPSTVARLLQ